MTASSPSFSRSRTGGRQFFPAAFEVLVYLALVAGGALGFQLGWLGINGAVILCTLLLAGVTALAWYRFDEGRHPCFLFLCALMSSKVAGCWLTAWAKRAIRCASP